MSKLVVNERRFLSWLEELSRVGNSSTKGVTRFALTEGDRQAREWLQARAREHNLQSHFDAAGNLFIYAGPKDEGPPPVIVGSHVDTVPDGGRFDGALGVLAGLESLIRLQEMEIPLSRPVWLAVWTEEEGSRFPGGLIGSRAFIGEVSPTELEETDANGVTLAEALRNWGLTPEDLPQVARQPGQVHAYVELHIEQGAKLDQADQQIGVVTGIVGIRRYNLSVKGQANHAGTTPMQLRQDALVAASLMVQAVEEVVKNSGYEEAVGTVGQLRVYPGGVNVVPGRVDFSLEIRDIDEAVMDELANRLRTTLQGIATERGVELSWETAPAVKPSLLDESLQQTIAEVATDLGYSWRYMPSGAGHDAQHLARICPTGMIFVPSKDGISHSPDEFTADDDCVRGANVLLNTIARLAQ
ncbi:MAG: Zn-dependent hydrolase [Firmicutes bacterium]|nr:Zn-dependent hydrolase [Bacillota bacterium]